MLYFYYYLFIYYSVVNFHLNKNIATGVPKNQE